MSIIQTESRRMARNVTISIHTYLSYRITVLLDYAIHLLIVPHICLFIDQQCGSARISDQPVDLAGQLTGRRERVAQIQICEARALLSDYERC
jgi:hypothetical protein